MLIGRPVFYVGLIDGSPAYQSFTNDSITVELFRDAKSAKQKFREIARCQIEPKIVVTTIPPWDYTNLSNKIVAIETQLREFKELQTKWRLKHKWIALKAWPSKLLSRFHARNP